VPPPAEYVDGLLNDLVTYVNGDDHSPLVQAALSHAQFEIIHPFADGNGRSGRALIHVVLRRRSISPTVIPPISLVLATWADDYISGLTGYRHDCAADSTERSEAAHIWLRTFAGATLRACADAGDYAARIEQLTNEWRSELGTIRRDSALDLLVAVLPAVPLLTVESASRLISRSGVAASGAINRLLDAGILVQRNVGKQRYRIFEAPTVLALFTSLERALASPSGDTASEPPIRPVPSRPLDN
jgi:Fic family protein